MMRLQYRNTRSIMNEKEILRLLPLGCPGELLIWRYHCAQYDTKYVLAEYSVHLPLLDKRGEEGCGLYSSGIQDGALLVHQ